MYMQHLLKSEELEGFNECLMPHQKAMTADGFTQLEKAVVENNMLAASRVYDNISFEQLGYILRMDSDKAARVAAKMITEERLKATIDQTEGILLFQEGAAPGGVSFDARLKVLCDEVTVCCDIAQGKYAMKMSE
jgi:COP9 signalosome complex subunit 4